MLNFSVSNNIMSRWKIHDDGPNGSGKPYKTCLARDGGFTQTWDTAGAGENKSHAERA